MIERLRRFAPFDGLGEGALGELAADVASLRLARGEPLASPTGESLQYLVLEGRLALSRDGRPDHALVDFGPGSMVKDLPATQDGGPCLVAAEESELAVLSDAGLERLAQHDAGAAAAVAAGLSRGGRKAQLAIHLGRLFENLEAEILREIEADVEWVALSSGDTLFVRGDPGDSAYVVISGRVRAVLEENGRERALNDVTAGETVGEMALLSDDTRSATVYAVRDSQLARLSRAAFDRLTERHPQALRRIAGFVVDRLRRQSGGRTAPRAATVAFAVLPARQGVDAHRFAQQLADKLRAHGRVEHLTRRMVESALGVRGVADAGNDDPASIRLVQWLNERDTASRYLLYETEPRWSGWTDRAVRQADHVLVVASALDDPGLGEVEERLTKSWSGPRAPEHTLVLVHPPGTEPSGTSHWLDRRPGTRHYHVRSDDDADFARLARLLTGQAVGVVFGGGGARGFAHLGVLRAMEEVGVPIDLVGGTSIGAIIATLPALGLNSAQSLEQCRQHFRSIFDLTLPVVALLAGRRIGSHLDEGLGQRQIEDLRIPFFCVACNLSKAEQVVLRRGSVREAVRSSISLPGILPPVPREGELLVDGGLLNNLPIDVMDAESRGGLVVALDVSPEVDLQAAATNLAAEMSGWKLLWQRIKPFAVRGAAPHIVSVLMRSAVVASIVADRERRAAEGASLYLKIPVSEWGLLDFDALEKVEQRGYETAIDAVRRWWEARAGQRGGA